MRGRAGRPRPAARGTVSPEVCPYLSRTKETSPTFDRSLALQPWAAGFSHVVARRLTRSQKASNGRSLRNLIAPDARGCEQIWVRLRNCAQVDRDLLPPQQTFDLSPLTKRFARVFQARWENLAAAWNFSSCGGAPDPPHPHLIARCAVCGRIEIDYRREMEKIRIKCV